MSPRHIKPVAAPYPKKQQDKPDLSHIPQKTLCSFNHESDIDIYYRHSHFLFRYK